MNTENKTNQTNTQTREISKETSRLIEALDLLLQTESSVISYVYETYGDQTELWDKSAVRQDIEDLKVSLKLLLGDSVELNLGYIKDHII